LWRIILLLLLLVVVVVVVVFSPWAGLGRDQSSVRRLYIYIFKIPSVEGSGMSVQYIEIIMAKGLKKARRIVEHLEGKFPV